MSARIAHGAEGRGRARTRRAPQSPWGEGILTRPRAPPTLRVPVRRDHDVANSAEADHAARSGDPRDPRQQGVGCVRGDEYDAPAHVALAVRQGSGRLRLRADRPRRAHHRPSPRYRLQPVRRSGRHAHDSSSSTTSDPATSSSPTIPISRVRCRRICPTSTWSSPSITRAVWSATRGPSSIRPTSVAPSRAA